MKKCFFLKTLSEHGKNRCFRHLGVKSWYWEDRCAVIFHRTDWPERPHGIDFFEKCSISKNRNPENCPKMFRNGSRKMIQGVREVRKGQNCAPDAMEALPEFKNPIKNLKNQGFGGYMENSRSTALAAAMFFYNRAFFYIGLYSLPSEKGQLSE